MEAITDINQLDFSKVYNFQDYLSWKFKERVELLKGYIARMSPAPSSRHQRISWNLAFEISSYLRKKECKAFSAPFDVYLPKAGGEGQGQTVVQPDLCVICDISKIKKHGCVGSPDLIIEILSPGNSRREMKDKFEIYEQAGVKEYWVVFPSEEVVQIYDLKEGQFTARRPLAGGDRINSKVLEEIEIQIDTIFENDINFDE